jgi:hypothetical protein
MRAVFVKIVEAPSKPRRNTHRRRSAQGLRPLSSLLAGDVTQRPICDQAVGTDERLTQ